MQDIFKIYIDRLKNDECENLKIEADPAFLEVDENELIFKKSVRISAKAYIAQDDLVIDLNAQADYNMPCSICNELVENSLSIERFIQTIALDTIKNSIFDFSLLIRDEILLQVPNFVECSSGNCKKRSEIGKYLTKNKQGHFPFQEL